MCVGDGTTTSRCQRNDGTKADTSRFGSPHVPSSRTLRRGHLTLAFFCTLRARANVPGINNVMPGVAPLIKEVQVECTFPDGTKLGEL